jgi:hypothetical protein
MNWHSALGSIASIASFTPILLILVFRLYNYRPFLGLLFYFLFSASYNFLAQGILPVQNDFLRALGVFNNLTDAPLMLIFLTFFTAQPITKYLYRTALLFMVFEIVILCLYGYGVKTVKIVLGPDIAIIATISFFFFLRYVRMAITNSKTTGKATMISAVLLAYSIYSMVYIFYYLLKTKYIEDAQIVYYTVTLLSACLMSMGILIENKRIKKLNELKTTRKELAIIYGKGKTPAIDSRF